MIVLSRLFLLWLLAACFPAYAVAASFFPLGDIEGGDSENRATAVAGETVSIVGTGSSSFGAEAVLWTDEGLRPLGVFSSDEASFAADVSADGALIVGTSVFADDAQAVFWLDGEEAEVLDELPGGDLFGQAFGVSDDKMTIVGLGSDEEGVQAVKWTGSGFFRDLEPLPDFGGQSVAQAVSEDGEVIVGWAEQGGPGLRTPVIWRGEEINALSDAPTEISTSGAFGVSRDGQVVVGQTLTDSGLEAFRWSEEGGLVPMRGLAFLPGAPREGDADQDGEVDLVDFNILKSNFGRNDATGFSDGDFNDDSSVDLVDFNLLKVNFGSPRRRTFQSAALAASADGAVIVGTDQLVGEAFIWTEPTGVQRLFNVLSGQFGLAEELKGWRLLSATGVSDDGTLIAGDGINPDGERQAWTAFLVDERTSLQGDINGDGRVDLIDFNILKENFGRTAAVPEPTAWLLLLAASLSRGFVWRRESASRGQRRLR